MFYAGGCNVNLFTYYYGILYYRIIAGAFQLYVAQFVVNIVEKFVEAKNKKEFSKKQKIWSQKKISIKL